MKAKIRIKRLADVPLPKVIDKGDWVDLYCAEDSHITEKISYIPLGVAVRLPDGYEAIVASRSSTPKKQHITNYGAIGVIDNSYNGNTDQWMWPTSSVVTKATFVEKGTRICQFRIQLSQKATTWQRIKWLFTSGIEIVEVDDLKGKARGGLGTTGTKEKL